MTILSWNEGIQKRVRAGDWTDQVISTVGKIEQAITDRRWEQAAELVDYFMEEAKVCHSIYGVWLPGFIEWLRRKEVPDAVVQAELGRLKRLLAFPDGAPFDPSSRWTELGGDAGRLGNRLRSAEIEPQEALAELNRLREGWQCLHDRWVDTISGVLAFIARRFGETALEDCYRFVLEPYIEERYMPFDLRHQAYEDTIFRNLYLAIEAMRGHLCGPDRRGDLGLREYEDRWELSFDPCGSGGRSSRGDPDEGTGSRVQAPYEFGVTQEEHDWAWNERGVCYYCAHCCFALERIPAERWGHPVRVVDSPLYPQETTGSSPKKCRWTIYKRLEAIPEEAYRRVGLNKPS